MMKKLLLLTVLLFSLIEAYSQTTFIGYKWFNDKFSKLDTVVIDLTTNKEFAPLGMIQHNSINNIIVKRESKYWKEINIRFDRLICADEEFGILQVFDVYRNLKTRDWEIQQYYPICEEEGKLTGDHGVASICKARPFMAGRRQPVIY